MRAAAQRCWGGLRCPSTVIHAVAGGWCLIAPSGAGCCAEGGGKIRIPAPIQYSNVRLLDPVSGGPVRVKTGYAEDGTKVRISVGKHATGSIIPKPAQLAERAKPRNPPSVKDTSAEAAARVTYNPDTMVEDFKAFAAKVLGQQSYPKFRYPPLQLENLPVRSRMGQDQGLLPIAASEALRLRPKPRLSGNYFDDPQ